MTFDVIKKRCFVNDLVSFKTKSGDAFSGTVIEIDDDTVIICNSDGDEEYISGDEIVSFKKHLTTSLVTPSTGLESPTFEHSEIPNEQGSNAAIESSTDVNDKVKA